MNDLEKKVLVSFEKKNEMKNKYKDMSDDQLEQLESKLYELWKNDRHNVALNNQILEVQYELTSREDEAMWQSEMGWCE